MLSRGSCPALSVISHAVVSSLSVSIWAWATNTLNIHSIPLEASQFDQHPDDEMSV